tara:strand:- start:209274 stop:210161 length:888 start_codon:yes stop_codon:yes gene_type:complete
MEMKNHMIWLILVVLAAGCTSAEKSDAYGQFEADEVIISAEVPGTLLRFDIQEGTELNAGVQIGLIDTLSLQLRKNEAESSLKAVQTKLENLNAQVEVYKAQLETASINLRRIEALAAEKAATDQQLDDVKGKIKTLDAQIHAVRVQKQSVYAEMETIKSRIAQVEDQIRRAKIINPINGVVLAKYAEQAELVGQGKPLYQIANLDELELRVFITGAQLTEVKLGEQVEVLIDKDANDNESLSGTVSWISSEAEFTPKMIQTKDERVTQVYAVKIRVQNPDGKLKIGMPGEVNFN